MPNGSEIQGKYTKIVKNANLIGFLNRLAISFNLTDSQPLDIISYLFLLFAFKKLLFNYSISPSTPQKEPL